MTDQQPNLTYEVYNKNSFVVHGDRSKYDALLKTVGGRWNPRLTKCNPGWTVPLHREPELKKLVENINTIEKPEKRSETLPEGRSEEHSDNKRSETSQKDASSSSDHNMIEKLKQNVKSRKGQTRYHRAVSDSSNSEHENKVVPEKHHKHEERERRERQRHERQRHERHERKRQERKEIERREKEKREREKKEEREKRERKGKEHRHHDKISKKSRDFSNSDTDDDRVKYYESFSTSPRKFKKLYKHNHSSSEENE